MDIYTLDGLFRNSVAIMPNALIEPSCGEFLVATITLAILVGGWSKKVEKDGQTTVHHKTGSGIVHEGTIIEHIFDPQSTSNIGILCIGKKRVLVPVFPQI